MPKPKLRAGATIEFRFPELPQTLWSRVHRKRNVTKMLVCLPENYEPGRKFPLFVYLNGGEGSSGAKVHATQIRKVSGTRDLIAVSLPLFKKELDPNEFLGGILISAFDDYPIISRCYRKMLSKLFETIPNIASGEGAFGGFSNGGHTTSILLSALDPFILRHFRHYFFVDGGTFLTSLHKNHLRNKRILYLVGGSRRKEWRRHWIDGLKSICYSGRLRKLDITYFPMPGVEHAFPEAHMPTLRAWVKQELPSAKK
jgi:hypothetical protein